MTAAILVLCALSIVNLLGVYLSAWNVRETRRHVKRAEHFAETSKDHASESTRAMSAARRVAYRVDTP